MWSALSFLTSRTTRTSAWKNRRRLAERRTASRRLQLEPLEERCLLTSYILTELGPLPGGYGSTPNDINAAGQVVGTAGSARNDRAVLWNNGIITDLGTLRIDNLNGYSQSLAINDLGQIVGFSSVIGSNGASPLENHAFLITPEDTDANGVPDRWFRDLDADGVNDLMIDLGLPADATYSLGVDINNAGQIVAVGNRMAYYTAFLWEGGAFTELDAFAVAGGGASSINDAGQVVGDFRDAAEYSHPFVWDSSRGTTELGTIDYPYGRAKAINNSGSIVGRASSDTQIAFLWTPNQLNGTVGEMTALDPLPDESYSSAEDINDAGLVVGTSTNVSTTCEDDGFGEVCVDHSWSRVVLWENGVPSVLQDQVVGQSVNLTTANAINASGQIVGWGSNGGYLLTPTGGPIISVSDVNVVEGDSGSVSANFTISLDAASNQPVTITYATANGTATAGSDYVAASDTLTFAPSETSKTVTVLVKGDTLYEPHEAFFLKLTSPTNGLIADGSGTGTIQNDDPTPPSLVISNASVTEGNAGTVSATFTVSLSATYGQPVTVHYETADGSATAGSDYTPASGDVIIAAGQTSQTVTVAVLGDRSGEPAENFVVSLTAATNALIVDSQGVGTIMDDEPRISISDVTKAEGKKNQTTLFTFTVTLSTAYDQTVTMSFRAVNGTAKTGDDYVAKTGTLTFAPGETTKTITIEVKGDIKKESNEVFYLDLFGLSSNALFTKNRGIGTILNDD